MVAKLSPRASRWLESGWLDPEYYEVVRGRAFADAAEAAEDFTTSGMDERLSPHPLLHFVTLPTHTRRAWRHGRVGRVLADLGAPPGEGGGRAEILALAARTVEEPAREALVDWADVASAHRPAERVSVVVGCRDPRSTLRTVRSVLATTAGQDVEVLVLDRGSPPHVVLGLRVAFLDEPAVRIVRLASDVTDGAASNVGVASATGGLVLLLEPQVVVRRGCVASLQAALAAPEVAGVQPVVLGPQDTIVSAGLAQSTADGALVPVLRGHLADDARRLEGDVLTALSPEAVMLRVADVAAVGGLPTSGSDVVDVRALGARLLGRRPGGFRVAPLARVTSLAAAGDADLTHLLCPAASAQRRWTLRIPSPPGALGDVWGDTHFAEALADALRGLGEEVVVSRRTTLEEPPADPGGVSLALRGLFPVAPVPGRTNVLWVISHPDEVDLAELDGYDHVFAASEPWSEALSRRAGRPVVPLLQASSFEPPTPRALPDPAGVVFVGSAGDGRQRPLVRLALEAELPLAVYGPGWAGLPDGVWRAEYVENDRLPEVYREHGVVLADHWPDMARGGFIANRVFDAVAAGARVLCDDVLAVNEVFDPADVVVVRSGDEMREAFDRLRATPRRDDVPRPSLSFRDRARVLLDEVSR